MKLLLSAIILSSSFSSFAASRECVLEAKAAGEAISKLNFPRKITSTRAVLLQKDEMVKGVVDYTYDIMPSGDPNQPNYKVVITKDSGKCYVSSVMADANG